MTKQDPLFTLIKSLNGAEKRYFKLFTAKYESGKGTKGYMRLFDFFDGQKKYDKNATQKKLQGKFDSRPLTYAKIYLQQQILNSLKNFHINASENMKLNNYMAEIELLYKKRLFGNCLQTLKKAIAYAEKYEMLPELLRLAEWKILLTGIAETDPVQSEKSVQEAINEREQVINQYSELAQIEKIFFESHYMKRSGRARTDAEKAAHDDIINHPVIIKKAGTVYGEYRRLRIKLHNAEYKNDFEGINRYNEAIIGHFETYPDIMAKYRDAYIYTLIDWTVDCFTENRFIAAEKLIHKIIHAIEGAPGCLGITDKMFFLSVQCCFYMAKGEFAEALDFANEMDILAQSNSGELSPADKLLLYQRQFDVHFGSGNYEKAGHFIKKIRGCYGKC